MQVFLIRVTADGKAQPVPITNERTLIGRLDDCQIRVRSGKISSNGTFLNKERVEESELKAGDLISFGSMVFLVQIDGDPEEFEPEQLYADGLPELPAPNPEYAAAHTPKPVHQHAPTAAGDDSSMMDFNFEFDLDDDDEQPPL